MRNPNGAPCRVVYKARQAVPLPWWGAVLFLFSGRSRAAVPPACEAAAEAPGGGPTVCRAIDGSLVDEDAAVYMLQTLARQQQQQPRDLSSSLVAASGAARSDQNSSQPVASRPDGNVSHLQRNATFGGKASPTNVDIVFPSHGSGVKLTSRSPRQNDSILEDGALNASAARPPLPPLALLGGGGGHGRSGGAAATGGAAAMSWATGIGQEVVVIIVGGLAVITIMFILLVFYGHMNDALEKRYDQARNGRPPTHGPNGLPRSPGPGAGTPLQGSRTSIPAPRGKETEESIPRSSLKSQQVIPPPICDSLIVPNGKRLNCRVPCLLNRTAQDLDFMIFSAPSRGGVPLIKVRAVESRGEKSSQWMPGTKPRPRVVLEHMGKGYPLATVLTEALYGSHDSDPFSTHGQQEYPDLTLLGTNETTYGTIGRRGSGFVMFHQGQPVLNFTGDFQEHRVDIKAADGQVVAIAEPPPDDDENSTPGGTFQVEIESNIDAGMILIGLLAIDKFTQDTYQ